jgi:type I restriction enzyme S subunit
MLDAKKNKGKAFPYLRNPNVRWFSIDLSDLREMPFEDHELDRFGVRRGDVLICEGGEAGRAAIWESSRTDVKIQKAIHRVRCGPSLHNRFLVHRLMHDYFSGRLEDYHTGTTIKHFTGQDLAKYEFFLPPLSEQKRIAGILDAADALRAKRREALAQLDSLLQATFLDLFGDPVSNPKGWVASNLDAISRKVTDGEHLNPAFTDDGMPMVMAGNVLETGVDLENVKHVPNPLGERFRKKCGPERGDLLLVSRGATIGRMCMVTSKQPFCLMGSVILIKVNHELTSPTYLTGFLRCPAIRGNLYATSGSSAQQAIYIKDIRKLKCVLPPLGVQRKYDVIAESVARQVPQHVAHLAELDALFASLQSRAFRGEL